MVHGDCAVIQIEIDTSTGTTCERCILDDGTVSEESCEDTSIACVLVTIPDPDCVVCAYVNGAVLFASCIVGDVSECTNDWVCIDVQGFPGSCIDGECVYNDLHCSSDAGCPDGWARAHVTRRSDHPREP